MTDLSKRFIGYTCAYAPIPLIDAAGFAPYRIFPSGNPPDHAGHLIHDNMCPHVKRILNRVMAADIPPLSGAIVMNSCDTMRRLGDAWMSAKPTDKIIRVDMPVTSDANGVAFFARQLKLLNEKLSELAGGKITDDKIRASIARYNDVAMRFTAFRTLMAGGKFNGGASRLQSLYCSAACQSLDESLSMLDSAAASAKSANSDAKGVPVYVFGNVLNDPEVFTFIETCGARVVAEDVCTGSRMWNAIEMSGDGELMTKLARGLLNRAPCARTISTENPARMGGDIIARVKELGVKGVIGHTVKFCDPYIARIPLVREKLRKEGIPFLLLEGDCTMGSIGQQRTRIEAFMEMLG